MAPASLASPSTPQESSAWKWGICGLLLMATTLNYMDRQALAQTSVQISHDFQINNEQYSNLVVVFNVGFGLGAVLFGWLADKGNLRWIYAGLVLAWSTVGFITGFVNSMLTLLYCRLLLGLFEAGNWPCGILTVKRILKPEERSLGNGLFQSGTALGAIIIPLVVLACAQLAEPGDPRAWRLPFRLIGGLGLLWVVLWLATVRSRHISPPPVLETRRDRYWDIWLDRRFYVMIVVVVSVNVPWRSLAEWMPKFLNAKGYSRDMIQVYSSLYYLAADVGSIGAGLLTLWLFRHGRRLTSARLIAFTLCAALTTLTAVLVHLPQGLLLGGTLLIIGVGNLGSFSSYYAFSQEISAKHQGKLSGTLGLINAGCMAGIARLQGWLVDEQHSFTAALGITGLAPLAGVAAIYFFWDRPSPPAAPAVVD